jgi:hypothetical protein
MDIFRLHPALIKAPLLPSGWVNPQKKQKQERFS